MDLIITATVEYILLRDRIIDPCGKFDKAGRWYPDVEEQASCCSSVHGPTRAYPYSYMVHCRTMKHVANKHGIEVSEIRKNTSKKRLPLLMGTHHPHIDELIKKEMKGTEE
jgi:hypothetical protein